MQQVELLLEQTEQLPQIDNSQVRPSAGTRPAARAAPSASARSRPGPSSARMW
ncbi:hypothetical protein [Streptomyces sp. NPDC088789]|uniref:hypothetical protein n=1 Tax=Streptomyces sp. NPDC088789 TaxID=3365899 RepID=UPI003819A8FB